LSLKFSDKSGKHSECSSTGISILTKSCFTDSDLWDGAVDMMQNSHVRPKIYCESKTEL